MSMIPSRRHRPSVAPTRAAVLPASGPLCLCLLVVLGFWHSPPSGAEVSEEWIEETIFRLEDLEGDERRETLLKASETNDKRLTGVLSRALLAGKKGDTDEVKERVTAALCRMAEPTMLETVSELCSAEDLETKERGLMIMGHLRSPEAITFLQQRIPLCHGTEKAAAIEALGYTGEKNLVPYLQGLLKQVRDEQKVAVRMSLARLGINRVIPALLQDYERTQRQREALDSEAKGALRLTGRDKARKLKRVRDKRKTVNRSLREQRRFFLDIPPTAIPEFVRAANGGDLVFSFALILENLPRMANRETAPLFIDLLHNQYPLIRLRALDILEKYRNPETDRKAREILAHQLKSEEWRDRRFVIRNCNWLPDDERITVITSALDDPSRAVRLAALKQIAKYRVAKAQPRLRELLSATDDVDLIAACRDAIEAIEGE